MTDDGDVRWPVRSGVALFVLVAALVILLA